MIKILKDKINQIIFYKKYYLITLIIFIRIILANK